MLALRSLHICSVLLSLQESIVQQPELLQHQPQQAAAVIWSLERCLRASVVWFGPNMCSKLLINHTPHSIQQHLDGECPCSSGSSSGRVRRSRGSSGGSRSSSGKVLPRYGLGPAHSQPSAISCCWVYHNSLLSAAAAAAAIQTASQTALRAVLYCMLGRMHDARICTRAFKCLHMYSSTMQPSSDLFDV